jgi:hypothetical protein
MVGFKRLSVIRYFIMAEKRTCIKVTSGAERFNGFI